MAINENKIASVKVHVNKLDKITSLKEKDIKSILESIEIHYVDGKVEVKKELPKKTKQIRNKTIKTKKDNVNKNFSAILKQDYIINKDDIYAFCCFDDEFDYFIDDDTKKKNKRTKRSLNVNCSSNNTFTKLNNLKCEKLECSAKSISKTVSNYTKTTKSIEKEKVYTDEEVATILKCFMADKFNIHIDAVDVNFKQYINNNNTD